MHERHPSNHRAALRSGLCPLAALDGWISGMSYTRAIAEHYMQRIRERLLYGMTPSEEAQALAEVATYSRHERDLFALQNTAPSSRELLPGDKQA